MCANAIVSIHEINTKSKSLVSEFNHLQCYKTKKFKYQNNHNNTLTKTKYLCRKSFYLKILKLQYEKCY